MYDRLPPYDKNEYLCKIGALTKVGPRSYLRRTWFGILYDGDQEKICIFIA